MSLPMFRRGVGCLGVIMAGDAHERTVTTIWRSAGDLATFEESSDYRETVALISAQGFLEGEQRVSIDTVQLAWLPQPLTPLDPNSFTSGESAMPSSSKGK